jgi:hypothetical protein
MRRLKTIRSDNAPEALMVSKINQITIWGMGLLMVLADVNVAAGANQKAGQPRGEQIVATRTIQEVLKEHAPDLLALPGVVGVAQGLCDRRPCIKVYVIEKTSELAPKIPATLEGFPVVIEATGEIRALPEKRRDRRPH